jgi:microcystin degradation protein MlrC
VIETWDDAAGDFPEVIRELIGKDPEIAEEFDVEDVEA